MILRDPVHGLLAFESEEAAIVPQLLDTREVQRLRRIKQLGVSSLAFPGAEHTRFAHALGTAHVMQRLLDRLRSIHHHLPFWQRVSSDRATDAIAAAFLHDVGHGPLSHLFESALSGLPHHEHWSVAILEDPSTEVHKVLSRGDAGRPARVADLINGKHELPYLANAVSGTFDVDRCDYLLRDAYSTGVRHGHFDLDWLLRSLTFDAAKTETQAPALAIDGAKGLVAVEEFILSRFFMFQQVYFHKSTRAAAWMIRAALRLAASEVAEGMPLRPMPSAFAKAAVGDDIQLGEYLELDDQVLWDCLRGWQNAKHEVLADLCRRIRSRSLFKCLELHGEQQSPEGRQEALALAKEAAQEQGFDPAHYVGLDVAEDAPFPQEKNPPRVVFRKGAPRPLAEVSFVLQRFLGARFSKVRLVFAPELRDAIVQRLLP